MHCIQTCVNYITLRVKEVSHIPENSSSVAHSGGISGNNFLSSMSVKCSEYIHTVTNKPLVEQRKKGKKIYPMPK